MDLSRAPLAIVIIFIEIVLDGVLLLAIVMETAGLPYAFELVILVIVVMVIFETWLDLKYLFVESSLGASSDDLTEQPVILAAPSAMSFALFVSSFTYSESLALMSTQTSEVPGIIFGAVPPFTITAPIITSLSLWTIVLIILS
jgi:hypothetical protein